MALMTLVVLEGGGLYIYMNNCLPIALDRDDADGEVLQTVGF
jgi:hypothetical protein